MPGYRRFVAYVYEYRKGKKEENCGFLRVEAREEQCRIEVNIKCPGLPADTDCEIRGIVRTPNGVRGVKIGAIKTVQNGLQGTLTCLTDNMDQEGTGLADVGGMILLTEGGAFFGTEWDDVPIIPEDFTSTVSLETEENTISREEKEKKDGIEIPQVPIEEESPLEKREHQMEPEGIEEKKLVEERADFTVNHSDKKEEQNQEITATEIKEPEEEKTEKIPYVKENFEESKTTSEKTVSYPLSTIVELDSYEENAEERGASEKISSEKEQESKEEGKRSLKEVPANEKEMESDSWQKANEENRYKEVAFGITMPESERENRKKEPVDKMSTTSDSWKTPKSMENKENSNQAFRPQSFLPGEAFEPFSDGEITGCRKIHPKDLRFLAPYARQLRNNRFLSYGYYNFGHILLGKTAQNQYVLGVPGGYDQQEHFMASMYGFPYFKESSQIRLKQSRGGYWYRLINAPDSHHRNRL